MKTIDITTLSYIIDKMIQDEIRRATKFITNNPNHKQARAGNAVVYISALNEARYEINAAARNG